MSRASQAIKILKYATIIWPLVETLGNKIMESDMADRIRARREERRQRREARRRRRNRR